jgi:hypothetical protein
VLVIRLNNFKPMPRLLIQRLRRYIRVHLSLPACRKKF